MPGVTTAHDVIIAGAATAAAALRILDFGAGRLPAAVHFAAEMRTVCVQTGGLIQPVRRSC